MQLHLCVVYFASGIEKATGIQRWNGEAVWRALMRPDFAAFDVFPGQWAFAALMIVLNVAAVLVPDRP